MSTNSARPALPWITRLGSFVRALRQHGIDKTQRAQLEDWVISRFSLDELNTLLALIQRHDHRLQALGGVASPDVVLDAVLADVARDPTLAGVLKRARELDQEQRTRRAAVHERACKNLARLS